MPSAEEDIVREVEATIERLDGVRREIGRVIFGQQSVVDETLITLLAGGHALLVGVPGLAKTRLVETLGVVLGLMQKRVQFTPDLMPADILGSEVLEDVGAGKQGFRFINGPIFAQLLMADEINRASPRTQAALLQAMQERKVTVAGHDHALPAPFHVLATQNPIEQEGTYPLPEAQLDRFFMQVNVDYPSAEAERRMMIATTTGARPRSSGCWTGRPCRPRSDWCAGCRSAISWSISSCGWSIRAAGAQRHRRAGGAGGLGPGPARQPGADAGGPRAGAPGRPAGPLAG